MRVPSFLVADCDRQPAGTHQVPSQARQGLTKLPPRFAQLAAAAQDSSAKFA
jgi:hypothetical protein